MSNREDYERDLKRRQEEHLKNIRGGTNDPYWKPCAHDQCPECLGTGIKRNGSVCVHCLTCDCPKCTPTCVSSSGSTIGDSVLQDERFERTGPSRTFIRT